MNVKFVFRKASKWVMENVESIMCSKAVADLLGIKVHVLRHLMRVTGVRPLGRYGRVHVWTIEQLPELARLASTRRGKGRPRKGSE